MNSLYYCKYTRYWGKLLYYFREIDSTHTYSNYLLSKFSPRPGSVILADFQHTGRGQHGRNWQSVKGANLLFSSILYPRFLKANQSFSLNLVSSVALLRVIKGVLTSHNVRIKWPNDLMVGNRKVAGILTQTSLKNNRIDHAIISLGLNVNQMDFDPNLPYATSLKLEAGKSFNRQALFNDLCIEMELCLDEVKAVGIEGLLAIYEQNFYGLNKEVRLVWGQDSFEGICRGVDHRGSLIIQKADGSHHYCTSGSLEFL